MINRLFTRYIVLLGLLFSFQILQADEERSVTLIAGYNAVQLDTNTTIEYLVENIGTSNLLAIQGEGQGSAYKKKYLDEGRSFLNSFTQTEFGKAYWIKVQEMVTFSYLSQVYEGVKSINLSEGWNFVGPIAVLSLAKIQEQLGIDNVLIIQGAGQGQAYKKVYVDDGRPFLNSFTGFEQGKGYWVNLANAASLQFYFPLSLIAKDNTNHNVEIVELISDSEYTIRVYSDSEAETEVSQSTIAVYGQVNDEMVVLYINENYPVDAQFQVRVFNAQGEEVGQSDIVNYNDFAIEFSAFTVL